MGLNLGRWWQFRLHAGNHGVDTLQRQNHVAVPVEEEIDLRGTAAGDRLHLSQARDTVDGFLQWTRDDHQHLVDGHHSVVNADDNARKIRVREDCHWNGEGQIRADEHEADDQKQNGAREPLEPGRIALAGRTHYARRIRRKVHARLILVLGIGFRGIAGLIRFGGRVSRLFFRRGLCFDLDLRVIR